MAITVERLEAQVEADAAGAIADLTALDAALNVAARDRTATVNVDVDNGAAQTQAILQSLEGLGTKITSSMDGVGDSIRNMGGAAGEAASQVGQLGAAGGGTTNVINNMSGGFGSMGSQLLSLIPQIGMFVAALTAIYSAATIAVGAIQMLAAAAAGVVASLAPLVGLLGAIPVGLGAVTGGIGSVVLGLSGVTKAVTAMDQAQAASTRSTFSATQAARELKTARQGIVDANKAVTRAEEELKRAQEGVVEAQKEAARDLVEQRRAVRNAVWAEEDAVDRLKRAQENLARVQSKVGKSGAMLSKETDDFTGKVYEVARISADAVDGYDAQRDAQRELIRAQEDLERATERRKDQQEDLAEAEKKGIKGSDKYRDAVRRLEDAQQSLSRAHDNVAAANERLARVQEEQARRAAGGAAANNALNAAMAKLTPTGQKFARFIHDEFMPAIEDVKKAAQDGLLPGVQSGLEKLLTVMPNIRDEMRLFASGMGAAFDELMTHLTSKGMVKNLTDLGKTFREVLFGNGKKGKEATQGLLDALTPLSDILVSITKAAGPMTKELTNGVVGALNKLAAWMQKPANAKKMERFFNEGYRFLKLWGGVLSPLAGIFDKVVTAAKPLAEWMLEELGDWLGGINDKLKDPKGLKGLKDWFNDFKPAIGETVGFLKDLVKAIFGPQNQGAEGSALTKTMKALREEWIPAIERLLGTLSSDTESGPAFVGLLTSLTNGINTLVEDPDRITDFITDIGDLIQAMSDLLHDVQEFTDSSVWDALYALTVPFPVQIAQMWRKSRENNATGINEWEAYTRPRLEKTRSMMASLMNFIPVVGPVLSRVFRFITDRWLDIIGIFTSGDISGAIRAKFDSLATDVRRFFARSLNPIIEKINNIGSYLPGFRAIKYIDAYTEGGGTDKGRSTGGRVTTTNKTTGRTTRENPGQRAFGGSVEPGKTYLVGEKRPELLTMPEGMGGRIAAAVPRPMESTGGGITEEQLDRLLQRVLEKAKPNVDMKVEQNEHADPRLLASELAWSLR